MVKNLDFEKSNMSKAKCTSNCGLQNSFVQVHSLVHIRTGLFVIGLHKRGCPCAVYGPCAVSLHEDQPQTSVSDFDLKKTSSTSC